MSEQAIYLDNHATTPIDPEVFDAMLPFFGAQYGNPHSARHQFGERAATAVAAATEKLCAALQSDSAEVVYTSGATESNNLAVLGLLDNLKEVGRTHLITSAIEHKSVLECFSIAKGRGFEVVYLAPDTHGFISPALLRNHIKPTTGLVSIMAANNEIGTIQPIQHLASIATERGALFHTDASQAVGKIPLNFKELTVSAMSVSAHKVYGPKGIGALVVTRAYKRALRPLLHGGDQQNALRPGTVPLALCVGLAEAVAKGARLLNLEPARIESLKRTLYSRLVSLCGRVQINGSLDNRLPGNLNLFIEDVDSEALVVALRDKVAVSTGSACVADSMKPSHVLVALGLPLDRIESSIRLGLGRFTTEQEVFAAASSIAAAVSKLRQISSPIKVSSVREGLNAN